MNNKFIAVYSKPKADYLISKGKTNYKIVPKYNEAGKWTWKFYYQNEQEKNEIYEILNS